jgi:5-methylcytosine-specific restriction endonuclease McrA
MQKHVKVYIDYFDLGIDSIVTCEYCGVQGNINNGFDIHHLFGRICKNSNNIENLILLCRQCHSDDHNELYSKYDLLTKHKKNLK